MRYKMQKLINFFIISRNIFFFVPLHNCCFADTFTNDISSTEKHLREENTLTPRNLNQQFSILKKCRCKLECLIRDTVRFIRTLRSTLNTQTDAISAKRFINLHFHRDTVSAYSCQLDKFSFFANFRFKNVSRTLRVRFHHKLNLNFAFLENFFEKKKKREGKK